MKHRKGGKHRHKRLKPVKIPSSVNTYDELVNAANMGDEKAKAVVQGLDTTMEHFDVPLEHRRKVGDLLERFSVMICEQDEKVQVIIRDDDPMHNLIDMVEHFHRLMENDPRV